MKQSFVSFLVIACTITLFSSCANEAGKTESAAFSLDSAKAAIASSNKNFGESWVTGDSAKFVNCYTEDACINPPNMPKMCGSSAINAFFSGGVQMGIKNIVIKTEEVLGGPDGVVETGTYDMQMANNVSVDKGKFIVMWKQVDGKWKMHRDVWNSDLPCPPPPPTAK